MKGFFIAFEGTDGSGKKTQTDLLRMRLQSAGYVVVPVSFPQYGKKSAGLVEEYLNGKYGTSSAVSPYAASLFYAVDRFDMAPAIRKFLSEGCIVIADRYVDSNIGHQGGKIKNESEREQFFKWVYDTEYRILGIPRPHLTVIPHMPADVATRLIGRKQQRLYIERGNRDAHESDIDHLRMAEEAYLWLAEKYPEDHILIECMEEDALLPPEAVHMLVYQAVLERLPKTE